MRRVNPKHDMVKATGEVAPTNGTVVAEKKFSLTNTTDKMGITTGGSLTRAFFWGAAIATATLLIVGSRMNKINLSYSK